MGGAPSLPQSNGTPFSDSEIRNIEMEMQVELLTRKCITSHSDSDLTKGEQTCVDRCTVKWSDVSKMVQLRTQSIFEQQQKQQQKMMEDMKNQK